METIHPRYLGLTAGSTKISVDGRIRISVVIEILWDVEYGIRSFTKTLLPIRNTAHSVSLVRWYSY
jgi:hypothetical protein